MSYRIRRNDNVVVIAGQDKGKTGRVIFVNPEKEFVKVENVNMISKHRKARSAQDQGGIQKLEGNIHISNVQLICPSCNKATRIAAKTEGTNKFRACKKCGAALEFKQEKVKKGKSDTEARESKRAGSKVKRVRKTKDESSDEKN